nr:ABC transporter ATP-binding protein [candidate division Zixibacteria bacterium]
MTDSSQSIKIQNLSKRFSGGVGGRPIQALSDVSLEVAKGEIFGLLGPNGAGKTTLVKILLGSLHPNGGTASINGHEINSWKARRRIGYLPENHRFPSYMTGFQFLQCYGGMTGMSKKEIKTAADNLLELVGMTQWRDTRIRKYSKGMMQRLGLAQALINDPWLIFLDEPTDGVDPIGRHEIRNILLDLKKSGKTVFLNSHLLAEVETICDKVAILDKGKMIKSGPVMGLIGTKPAYRVMVENDQQDLERMVKDEFPKATVNGNLIILSLEEATQINGLIDLLRDNSIRIISVIPEKISLEESFMRLIRGNIGNE